MTPTGPHVWWCRRRCERCHLGNELRLCCAVGGGVLAEPDTTLDGYPAWFSTPIEGGEALQVFDVDGLYIEMMIHGTETSAALPGGLQGLFRATQYFPDPAGWR